MAGRHGGGHGRGNGGPMVGGIFFVALISIFFIRDSFGFFWIFPLFIIAFLSVFRHLTYTRRTDEFRAEQEEEREEIDERLLEKQVLKAAKKNDGKVTPALIALDSSLSIEQAETVLLSFVKRGYATMEVTDSGQIEYRFAEFLPPGDTPVS